jgi:hypothetical protein
VILAFRRPCADHRPALLDFIDRGERTSATPAALAHLERCARCERELADAALAITGLRRIRDEIVAIEPPGDAWLRLRTRIRPPADPWRWRATLGGLATSAMLVAVLVLPSTVGGPGSSAYPIGIPDSPEAQQREQAYLASIRAGILPAAPRAARDSGSVPRNYPPEIAQVRKEVTSAPPSVRPSEPI